MWEGSGEIPGSTAAVFLLSSYPFCGFLPKLPKARNSGIYLKVQQEALRDRSTLPSGPLEALGCVCLSWDPPDIAQPRYRRRRPGPSRWWQTCLVICTFPDCGLFSYYYGNASHCTNIHTHTYIHPHICMYMYMCSTYIHTSHTYTSTYIQVHTSTYMYIHIYIHIYIHTYIHACMHAYIHTYTSIESVM